MSRGLGDVYKRQNVVIILISSALKDRHKCTNLLPHFGTGCTNGWYMKYQRLVRLLPMVGICCTNGWYAEYHRLVYEMPPGRMQMSKRAAFFRLILYRDSRSALRVSCHVSPWLHALVRSCNWLCPHPLHFLYGQ